MTDLERKAAEMRNAIDMIEGALMGLGIDLGYKSDGPSFLDVPKVYVDCRDDLVICPKMKLGEVRRVCNALTECTRIINSEEFNPDQLRRKEP